MDESTIRAYENFMDKPIAFHRILKTITGNTNAALFLSQAWYWSKNKTVLARHGWFYKTAIEWEEETGLTRREQETARRICRGLEVIEEKLKKVYDVSQGIRYGHATRWYKVNKKRLYELLDSANLKSFSLAQSAKLVDSTNAPNYIDSTNPPIYLNRDYQRLPHKAGGVFKNWKDTPETFHPYFKACINKPIALPEPTTKREINAWLETFDEWTQKGFAPDQVVAAARWARKNNKAIARPGSLTWILNDQHSRKNGQEDHAKGTEESELETIAKRQNGKKHG